MARGGKREGSGRKKGTKSPATLEREAALRAFREMVIEQIKPLFVSQMLLAKGVSYVYRVRIGERGGRSDPVLVTDQEEVLEALKSLESGTEYAELDEGEEEDGESKSGRYYFVTTKPPDNKALDSLLDRALGKAVGLIELPPDADEGALTGFIFKRNENNNAGNTANS